MLLALALFVTDIPADAESFGRVVSVAGKVTAMLGDSTRALTRGDKLYKGDVLKSADGAQAQLLLADRTVMSLGPNAELVLSKIEPLNAERPKVGVKLVVGRVWARVQKWFGGGNSFTVETTNAVAGVRGTSIIVSYVGSKTNVALERGLSTVVGKDGKEQNLTAMTQLSVDESGFSEVGALDASMLGDLLSGFAQAGGFSIDGVGDRLASTEQALTGGPSDVPPVQDPVGTVPTDSDNSPVNLDPQQSNRESVIRGTIQIVD